MKCMEYANKHNINIIPKEDFEDLVVEVFQVIAENISKSLGPLGSSATIFDGTLVEATKDGYHILDQYKFNNRYKKMIYNLIKTPCTKMNNTVGDGTTTAIVLTNAIFQEYKRYENDIYELYRLPRQLTQAWDTIVDKIVEKVRAAATPVDPSDYDSIYHLAYVSSNGNHEISTNIAKAYSEISTPSIKIKDSPTNKSYVEMVKGFEFPANLIHEIFVRNQDYSTTEKNAAIMILDHNLETDEFNSLLSPLNDVFRAMNMKFIVLVPQFDNVWFDDTFKRYFNMECRNYGASNFIFCQYRQGSLKEHQLEDLAVVLKTIVVSKELSELISADIKKSGPDSVVEKSDDKDSAAYRMYGVTSNAMMSMGNGSLFDSDGYLEDETYISTLAKAKADLDSIKSHTDFERQSYAAKIHTARNRVLQLEMKNFIYYVGADSELQKQIYKDAVDDVIKCVSSSVQNGVVPGCQISIIRACNDIMNEIYRDDSHEDLTTAETLQLHLVKLIRKACVDVYKMILQGPDEDGILKTIDNWNELDAEIKDTYDKLYAEDEEDVDERLDCSDVMKKVQKAIREKMNAMISESVKNNKVYDLETLELNDKIITSAETDTMVIRAASELIKILISGNQCIYIDPDVNNSHQDEAEIYT